MYRYVLCFNLLFDLLFVLGTVTIQKKMTHHVLADSNGKRLLVTWGKKKKNATSHPITLCLVDLISGKFS